MTEIAVAIISPTLLFIFQMIREHKKGFAKKLDQVILQNKRLELLNMTQHDPTEVKTIMNLFDEYRKMGGNSYAVLVYNKWKKKYVK